MPLPGAHRAWPGQDFNDRGHSLGTSVLKGPTEFIKTDEKKARKRINRGETLKTLTGEGPSCQGSLGTGMGEQSYHHPKFHGKDSPPQEAPIMWFKE